jgi:hypothetical protein
MATYLKSAERSLSELLAQNSKHLETFTGAVLKSTGCAPEELELVHRQTSTGFSMYFRRRDGCAFSGWKPIETAPRDGAPILLDIGLSQAVVGVWDDGAEGWCTASLHKDH